MQIQLTAPIAGPSLQTQEKTGLQLRPGSSFSAVVTGVEGKSVQLTMENGASFVARQESLELLHTGDTVTMQVATSENAGGSSGLKLLEINGQAVLPDQATGSELRLMDLNIPPTPANMAHAALLARMGLPVTPENVARFAQAAEQLTQLSPEQSALFAASSLPITESTAEAFLQCLTSPQQAAALLEGLTQYAAEHLPQTAKLLALLQENVQSSNTGNFLPTMDGNETAMPQPGIHNFPTGGSPAASPGAVQSAASEALLQPPAGMEALFGPESDVQSKADPAAVPSTGRQAQRSEAAARPLQAQTAPALQTRPPHTQEASPAFQSGQQTEVPALSNAAQGAHMQSALLAELEKADGPAPGPALRESAAKLPERLLRVLAAVLTETTQPEAGHNKIANVAEQTGTLINQLQLGAETTPVAYLQIPVRYREQQQTAELYVLKRQSGKEPLDEANATVAISLDTEHLGRVEAVLHAVQNVLTLEFRTETDLAAGLLTGQLPVLYAASFPAQYRLAKATVGLIQERITPLNAARQLMPQRPSPAAAGLDIRI